MSDGKRTDFTISDMVVIVLTKKLWEEYSLFSLDIKKGIVLKLMTRFNVKV